jgi:protein TonB
MPTLTPHAGRRVPLVPSRRVQRARNALAWAGGISLGLHLLILVALIVQFPETPPKEAPATPSVDVVFEAGTKKANAPAVKKGVNQEARQAAPIGPKAPEAQRTAQAAPPPQAALPPPPPPPPPPPEPPKPVVKPTPPKPPQPKPVPKPVPPPPPKPAPVPPRPTPPAPPLPVVKLPPPLPAPPVPAPPIPAPAPPAPPPPSVDTSEAEMNVPMPTLPPLSLPLPPPPLPLPPTPQQPTRTARRNPSRSRSDLGGMVMNGMSFSGGGSTAGGTARGLNLSTPETEQPGSGEDLSIKGDVGANWDAELRQWVEDHKYYPEGAGMMGQQGTVVVNFTVDRAGHVTGLSFVSTSGFALLDQAWLGLFRNAALPPFPANAKSNTAVITASMRFEIMH